MCDIFGGGSQPAQTAANQQIAMMEQQQQQHDAAVQQDTSEINNDFSQFTPSYYSGYENAYENAEDPQLTQQYGIARDQLTAQLAGNDQLEGSTGAYDLGLLDQQYNTAQAGIANSAADAANSLKSTVNSTENNLYGIAQQAVDPLSFASQAQQSAGAIVAPTSYPTLSSVFASALQPAASAATANNSRGTQAVAAAPNTAFNMSLAPV
jgi:hypothetical protein